MAVVVDEDFESGSDGAAVTTANTSATSVAGSMVFDTGSPIHNSVSCLVDSQTQVAQLTWAFPSTPTCWVRGYFVSDAPAAASPFGYTLVLARLGVSNRWRVFAREDGSLQLQIHDGTWQTAAETGGPVLDGATPFRLEVGSTSSQLTVNVYVGSDVEWTGPSESFTVPYSAGAVSQVAVGMGDAQTSAVTMSMDDIVVDNAANPGTAGGVPSFVLSASYAADSWSYRDATWTVDARASTGTVSMQQATGPAVSPVESPTGVFTVADPGVGGAPLVYDLIATSAAGVPSTRRIAMTRGGRAARLVLLPGGAADDANAWR